MEDKIEAEVWLISKPYDSIAPTDYYYLPLARRVRKALLDKAPRKGWALELSSSEWSSMACLLTAYLEDVVSGTGLWRAFAESHRDLFGQRLPFYRPGPNYYEEEINTEDLRVLLWYYINQYLSDRYLPSDAQALHAMADAAMDILDQAYDFAPENTYLKTYYELPPDTTDYYEVREFLQNIIEQSYLFFPDTGMECASLAAELFQNRSLWEGIEDKALLNTIVGDKIDRLVLNTRTRLLAFRVHQWAAALLGPEHPRYEDLQHLSPKVFGHFLYKGYDQTHFYLEHLATGKRFAVWLESFPHKYQLALSQVDDVVYIGIAHWRGEWWFSGLFLRHEQKESLDLIEKEKKSLEARQPLAFLDADDANLQSFLREQLKIFQLMNGGSPLAFLPSGEFDAFARRFWNHIEHYSSLSPTQKETFLKRTNLNPFEQEEGLRRTLRPGEVAYVVFCHPRQSIEWHLDVASAFPLPQNPYFRPEESEKHARKLVRDSSISSELVRYWVAHCGDRLPFFETPMGQDLLNNMEFMLRFYKKDDYYGQPTITLADLEELGYLPQASPTAHNPRKEGGTKPSNG